MRLTGGEAVRHPDGRLQGLRLLHDGSWIIQPKLKRQQSVFEFQQRLAAKPRRLIDVVQWGNFGLRLKRVGFYPQPLRRLSHSLGSEVRAVIQRVNHASVTVGDSVVGKIDRGLALLVGITSSDTDEDIRYLVDKTVNMRIFPAEDGSSGFDRSVMDLSGGLLLISQFTLYASTRKGRRPGFTDAAPPEVSQPLFDRVVDAFRSTGLQTQTGVFGAMMNVEIENAGPATFILDTADRNQPRRG